MSTTPTSSANDPTGDDASNVEPQQMSVGRNYSTVVATINSSLSYTLKMMSMKTMTRIQEVDKDTRIQEGEKGTTIQEDDITIHEGEKDTRIQESKKGTTTHEGDKDTRIQEGDKDTTIQEGDRDTTIAPRINDQMQVPALDSGDFPLVSRSKYFAIPTFDVQQSYKKLSNVFSSAKVYPTASTTASSNEQQQQQQLQQDLSQITAVQQLSEMKDLPPKERFQLQVAMIIHDKVELRVQDAAKLFDLLDTTRTGSIGRTEFISAYDANPEFRRLVDKYRDTALYLLTRKTLVKHLLDQIDSAHDGQISRMEWWDFVKSCIREDQVHLKRLCLLNKTAYGGRGLETPRQGEGFPSSLLCCIDVGWYADLWYFQRNHHPLLAYLLCDYGHPLAYYDRFAIDFFCISFDLLVYALNHVDGTAYLLAVLTAILLAVLRILLTYLFTQPCLLVRHEDHVSCLGRLYYCLVQPIVDCMTSCVRMLTYVLGVLFLTLGIIISVENVQRKFVIFWLISYGLSYVTCILLDLLLTFNTSATMLRFRERHVMCMGQLGLSQWKAQQTLVKQRWLQLYSSSATTAMVADIESSADNAVIQRKDRNGDGYITKLFRG